MTKSVGRGVMRYAAEFVVVFLGVSLSFIAENYRETRGDRTAERTSVERLLSDLREGDFDGEVSTYQGATDALRAILDARYGPPPSRDTLTAWLNRGSRCRPSVVNTSEYESLRNSGGFNRFRDGEFRQQLTRHYERYPIVYRLLDADCDWSFLDPVASELEASWTDIGPGEPSFRVTGRVQSILESRDLMLGLAQVHYRKNVLRQRFEFMAAERDSLILHAEQLLAEGL